MKYTKYIIIIIMLYISSCQNQIDSIRLIKQKYNINNRKNKDIDTINLFIDNSESMKGYLNPQNSELLETIKYFISYFNNANIDFYKLSKKVNKISNNYEEFVNEISKPNLFDGINTNLNKYLEYVDKDSADVSLLITDGIQSTKNKNNEQYMFSQKVGNLIRDDSFFSIYMKNSNFKGKYFCEKSPKVIKKIECKRPLLLFATGDKFYFQDLEKKISDLFDNSFSINAQNNYPIEFGFNKGSFYYMLSEDTSPVNYVELKLNTTDKITFNLISEQFENDKVLIKDKTIIVSQNMINKKVTECLYDYSHNIGENNLEIVLKVPKFSKDDIWLSKISFLETTPKWVKTISTNDDTRIKNIGKIYNFAPWIKYLMNSLEFDNSTYKEYNSYYLIIRR